MREVLKIKELKKQPNVERGAPPGALKAPLLFVASAKSCNPRRESREARACLPVRLDVPPRRTTVGAPAAPGGRAQEAEGEQRRSGPPAAAGGPGGAHCRLRGQPLLHPQRPVAH